MLIVVKVGTSVLIDSAGAVSKSGVEQIISGVAALQKQNHRVVLVSSGAVGTGKAKLPKISGNAQKQIWAAVGQPALMEIYTKYFSRFGLQIGQCLLLRDEFTDRERYANSLATISGLLDAGVVPIINENDVIAMEDLTVGDNDLLAAMVAVALAADRLIILTNQAGVYTANPDTDPEAKLIKAVKNVDKEFEKMFDGETSLHGRGGMLSKVRAAKHAVSGGVETIIADGRQVGVLENLGHKDTGKDLRSTRFEGRQTILTDQQRWLLAAKGFGEVIIDGGAAAALASGKSLLFPGMLSVKGIFEKGQVVEVMTTKGQTVAYGKVNYSHKELQRALMEKKPVAKEIIHRDYMVRLQS